MNWKKLCFFVFKWRTTQIYVLDFWIGCGWRCHAFDKETHSINKHKIYRRVNKSCHLLRFQKLGFVHFLLVVYNTKVVTGMVVIRKIIKSEMSGKKIGTYNNTVKSKTSLARSLCTFLTFLMQIAKVLCMRAKWGELQVLSCKVLTVAHTPVSVYSSKWLAIY